MGREMSDNKTLIVGGHSSTRSRAVALLLAEYELCVAADCNEYEIELRNTEPMELACRDRLQPVDKSFTPPHKKNRRGKFKRSGR